MVKTRPGLILGLAMAFCLAGSGEQAVAQSGAGGCAPPKPWREAYPKPGRPEMEFSACLVDQAYDIRDLTIPLVAAAGGIIAQCHIRVDRFEGVTLSASESGSERERQAADREAMRQANAALARYRQCAGK